jgi:hypothetical protein
MHKINPAKKIIIFNLHNNEKYKLIFKYLYLYFSVFQNQTRKKKYHESVYSVIVSRRGCEVHDG